MTDQHSSTKKTRSHVSEHGSGVFVATTELASCLGSGVPRLRIQGYGGIVLASSVEWTTEDVATPAGKTECEPCVERERVLTDGGTRPETETARGAVHGSAPSDRATARGTDGPKSSVGHKESCKRTHTFSGNLVDFRVGNKPETVAGDVLEWKGWSFKMRQFFSVVEEELHTELVDVEANPMRELLMVNMNQPQKTRARQLAFMLTMHTKDRAVQMITKPSDPTNGYEILRRFLEEWEPAHRGRYRAMLMTILQVFFTRDRGQAMKSGSDS